MIETKTEKKAPSAHESGKPVVLPSQKQPTHEEIAELAYQLWIERGSPDGSHEEDWQRAEEQLRVKPLSKAAVS